METRKKIVCLTPMTPEDQALVEALVDGELDDSNRRDLLVRLDRIDGGWKFCAVTFLEAQCFRESFSTFSGDWEPFFSDSSADVWRVESNAVSSSTSRTGQTASPAQFFKSDSPDVEVSDRASDSTSDAPRATSNGRGSEPTPPDAAPLDGSLFSGNAALRSENFSEYLELNDDVRASGAVASRRDLPEPRIIPLKRGGYRGASRNSSRDGSDGGGPTWRSQLASMAGGFLLAVALGGVFYLQISPSTQGGAGAGAGVEVGDATNLANVGTSLANVGAAASAAPNGGDATKLAQNQQNQNESGGANDILKAAAAPSSPNSNSSPSSFDVDGAVRVVTLKSPRHQLDNVSVPCFPVDRFDAKAFRKAGDDVPPQIAEQLRRSGGRVATTRDEYRFPLDDGRILILPVDTYDVRYEKANKIQ